MDDRVVEGRVYVGYAPAFGFLFGYVDSLHSTVGSCTDLQFLFNLSQRMIDERCLGVKGLLRSLEMKITSVRREFLEEICEIERESFSAPYPPHVFTVMTKETPETFLVAISKQGIVGYVLVSLRKEGGHVLSIAVRRDFRRRGVGTELMAEVLKVLLRKNVTRVDLEVRTSNHAAREFYGKLGFRETGLIRKYYGDGEDAVKMSKNLA